MDVECSNAQSFIRDSNAVAAVKDAISEVAGVPVSSIELALSVAARRLHGRFLAAGTVKVDYTISVPQDSAVTATTASGNLESQTTTTLTDTIQSKVSSKTSNAYITTVTDKSQVSSKAAVITIAPATTAATTTLTLSQSHPRVPGTASEAVSQAAAHFNWLYVMLIPISYLGFMPNA
jgi:hypothetical protein